MKHTVVERHDPARACELLHKLDALGVVLPLNLRVVREGRVPLGAAEELEARCVERCGALLASQVFDLYLVRLALEVLSARAGCRIVVDEEVRLLAVWWR